MFSNSFSYYDLSILPLELLYWKLHLLLFSPSHTLLNVFVDIFRIVTLNTLCHFIFYFYTRVDALVRCLILFTWVDYFYKRYIEYFGPLLFLSFHACFTLLFILSKLLYWKLCPLLFLFIQTFYALLCVLSSSHACFTLLFLQK